MYINYRDPAGLVVVERAATGAQGERAVQAALREFDDRLFVERVLDLDDTIVWVVFCVVGGDRPPVEILRWTDEHDRPLPLAHGLVDRVKQLAARRGERAALEAARHNDRVREKVREELRAQAADVAAEVLPRLQGKKMSILHRGVHLRQARSRRRDQGETGGAL